MCDCNILRLMGGQILGLKNGDTFPVTGGEHVIQQTTTQLNRCPTESLSGKVFV